MNNFSVNFILLCRMAALNSREKQTKQTNKTGNPQKRFTLNCVNIQAPLSNAVSEATRFISCCDYKLLILDIM